MNTKPNIFTKTVKVIPSTTKKLGFADNDKFFLPVFDADGNEMTFKKISKNLDFFLLCKKTYSQIYYQLKFEIDVESWNISEKIKEEIKKYLKY